MISEVKGFIESCHIMTIGTSNHTGVWTAPVYYVYHDTEFYFFSKPSSKHIKDAQAFARAAASIHHDPKDWNHIKGIQMEGTVLAAGWNKQSVEAFRLYGKKFPFTKEFMSKPFSGSLDQFQKQFKVRWYRFIPKKVVYLDNSISFGFKLMLQSDLTVCKECN